MDWKGYIDNFLKEMRCSSLLFYIFFHNALEFDKNDSTNKWRILSQKLKKWNEKYLIQYENISLCSPVMWNLNISINKFNISKDTDDIESWLYWACLSSYINYCVSNELILKIDENKINPQEYFLKSKENIEIEMEEFLNDFNQVDLFKKDYIWIDKKTFLQEIAQKRESSYKRLISKISDNETEKEKYVSNRYPMYIKYERYEALFQNFDKKKISIVEINPQGMNDLLDDCMCYIVKIENQIYILYFEDYA